MSATFIDEDEDTVISEVKRDRWKDVYFQSDLVITETKFTFYTRSKVTKWSSLCLADIKQEKN